mmetsp:Transcript_16949/g.34258  ORF Transcript_16949/g.34258 Transcript_16949/m.34258 type:complete len:277 (-) Transcript_16949:546-1376(-)
MDPVRVLLRWAVGRQLVSSVSACKMHEYASLVRSQSPGRIVKGSADPRSSLYSLTCMSPHRASLPHLLCLCLCVLRVYSRVVPVIVEATGGIAPTRAYMRYLARRSHGKGATDRTRYGTTRISTKSFYTHHGQMLVKAAVVYDSLAINKHIVNQRQKLYHEHAKKNLSGQRPSLHGGGQVRARGRRANGRAARWPTACPHTRAPPRGLTRLARARSRSSSQNSFSCMKLNAQLLQHRRQQGFLHQLQMVGQLPCAAVFISSFRSRAGATNQRSEQQ